MININDIQFKNSIATTPVEQWSDDNVFSNISDSDLISLRDYIATVGAEKAARMEKAKEREMIMERDRLEKSAMIKKSLDEMDARIASNRELAKKNEIQAQILEMENLIGHQQKNLHLLAEPVNITIRLTHKK